MDSFSDIPHDFDQQEHEMFMDLGLDPQNPDYSELAPHGMSGDEGDDEEVDDCEDDEAITDKEDADEE